MAKIILLKEKTDIPLPEEKHPLSGRHAHLFPLHTVERLGSSPSLSLLSTPGLIREVFNTQTRECFWWNIVSRW